MNKSSEKKLLMEQLTSEKLKTLFNNTCIESTTKHLPLAHNLRVEGNERYYKCGNDKEELTEIFKIYTKSIAYAPSDDMNMAVGYGNRSAVLHRMKKYRECISDIDQALKFKITDSFRLKWLCRKVECLVAQNSPDSKNVYNEVLKLYSIVDAQNFRNKFVWNTVEKLKDTVNQIKPRGNQDEVELTDRLTNLSILEERDPLDTVTVNYNKRFGNHLVVNRDLQPGDIVYVEKPYVSYLNIDNSLIYCSHCFTKSWSNIPCDYCYWSMYCSEACKNEAWINYHDIECHVVSYFLSHRDPLQYYDLLSLRSLIVGVKRSGISKLKSDFTAVHKSIEQNHTNLLKPDMLRNNDLKSIYTLCSTNSSTYIQKDIDNCLTILIILSKYTSFFGKKIDSPECLVDDENVVFVGTVLLRLMEMNLRYSRVEYDENSKCRLNKDSSTCKIDNCCFTYASIRTLTSLMCHNCNPNTRYCLTDGQKMIVYAVRPIKKNSQLFMGNRVTFFEDDKRVRERCFNYRLRRNSQILEKDKDVFNSDYKKGTKEITPSSSIIYKCNCEACKQNWPTLAQMYKMPKENAFLYLKTYNQKESDLFDKYNSLVGPILNRHRKMEYSKKTIKLLSEMMIEATKNLNQPSIVITELILCFDIVFKKLYYRTLPH